MGSFDTILAHIMESFHPTQLTKQMVQQNVEFWSEAQTQANPFRQYKKSRLSSCSSTSSVTLPRGMFNKQKIAFSRTKSTLWSLLTASISSSPATCKGTKSTTDESSCSRM
jgi:hypothetical protein